MWRLERGWSSHLDFAKKFLILAKFGKKRQNRQIFRKKNTRTLAETAYTWHHRAGGFSTRYPRQREALRIHWRRSLYFHFRAYVHYTSVDQSGFNCPQFDNKKSWPVADKRRPTPYMCTSVSQCHSTRKAAPRIPRRLTLVHGGVFPTLCTIRRPKWGRSPRVIGWIFGTKKPEWLGYNLVKVARWSTQSFGHNTSTWRTHRQPRRHSKRRSKAHDRRPKFSVQ